MNHSKEHSKLMDDTLVALCSYPCTRAFRMTVGVFLTMYGAQTKVGVKGMFDILVLRGSTYIWLDAKTGNAVLSREQKAFQRMVQGIGGVAEPYGSVAEALSIVRPY